MKKISLALILAVYPVFAIPQAAQVEESVPSVPTTTAATAAAACKTCSSAPRKKPVPKNDSIDGYKYSPARAAAEKSTAWANSSNAIVSIEGNGRVTMIYGQSVPKIGCAYFRVCSIELEPGETVNKVNAGDPVRWSITPAIVGEGAKKTIHVIIKPKSDEPGLYTNLKIATNRRMYDVDIFSVTGEKYVRHIGFQYPENDEREWDAQRLVMEKEEKIVTAQLPAVGVDKLNFNYSIEGDYAHKPVRVFDDTDKTYIQMSLDFKSQEAPVLVLLGEDGKEQLVNYRLKNGYYMLDKLFKKAALIIGVGGNQQRVIITRNGPSPVSQFFSSQQKQYVVTDSKIQSVERPERPSFASEGKATKAKAVKVSVEKASVSTASEASEPQPSIQNDIQTSTSTSTWTIAKGQKISVAMSAWVKEAGWKNLYWEASEFESEVDVVFPVGTTFETAVTQTIEALSHHGTNLGVMFYGGNKAVRITESK